LVSLRHARLWRFLAVAFIAAAKFHRRRQILSRRRRVRRARSGEEEQSVVRETLNSPRFRDQAPREVYATLLDEERYLCSWRTMYRILDRNQEVRERRDQLRHPKCAKPESAPTAPNQLWRWDITKLLGPTKGIYYQLYVIINVFSRYVPGWLLANCESAALAEKLVRETCLKQGILPDQLTLHADRSSSMKSKPPAMLLADLGVAKTHSRPRVSNDNPYSESQFKTMKYRPDFPDSFGSLEDARAWVRPFFDLYNHEHYHSSLGLLTPATVHYGQAAALLEKRQRVLDAAYAAHPERFRRLAREYERLSETLAGLHYTNAKIGIVFHVLSPVAPSGDISPR
jgi:putative transposase